MLLPTWPAPAGVFGLMTTREGGVSCPPWDSFNLGDHVGDDAAHVAENRARLRVQLPAEPAWLKQIHGTTVVDAGPDVLTADASVTRQAGCVCAVLTADCLPVLFCDRAGRVVAAAHAGWRGLAQGVLEATVAAMQVPPAEVLAWMGAAIGPDAFEVGDEVRQAFIKQHPEAAAAFVAHPSGGGRCTFTEAGHFYSYRREGVTGRMASLIWLG